MCDVHMFSWYVMFAFSHIALGPVQYEYWLRAKHAFDEDDSVTTPSDFKKFFLVQAEVYVQEELIPGVEACTSTYACNHIFSCSRS